MPRGDREWIASLGPGEAGRIALRDTVASALPHALGGPVGWLYVPGRIEVFGKHTDYAGGRSLLCAATRGICGGFVARGDSLVRVTDVATGEFVELPATPDLRVDRPGWSRYPATVVRRLARNFPGAVSGVDLSFASDLPQAAGMSSSSALMVAVLMAVAEASGLRRDPVFHRLWSERIDLAGYAACVENGASWQALAGDRGVGTTGGSEDHTAMLCAEPGRLTQCAFVPPRVERSVALPDDVVFAIGVSGVVAEKTGAARAAYNAAAGRAAALRDLWRRDTGRADGSLADALRSGEGALDHLRVLARTADAAGSSRLLARLDQFALETLVLVPAAAEAFESSDWASLGDLAARSHRAADEWLGNQVAETNALVGCARESGALAASAFGAGFGGSAWGLVPGTDATAFLGEWRSRYARRCPAGAGRAAFFMTGAGPAAALLEP